MTTIRLPHDATAPDGVWRPRDYQLPVWSFLERGGKRAICIWHRRSGKDEMCLRWMSVAMHQKTASYWYMLPEASQARKAIWEAINPHTGRRRLDEAFPLEIRASTRNSDMFLKLKCGSTFQVVGSDNYNSLVGSPPYGIVFSEYALANPAAWAFLRPILKENGGWAMFNTTARGRNHAFRLLQGAKQDEEWWAEVLSARDTDVFTKEELEQERREYEWEYGPNIGKTFYEQEYLSSFDAAIIGAYYGDLIRAAEADKRITRVPRDPRQPVIAAFDLGHGDHTAIWFAQQVGYEVRLIDYVTNAGVGIDWYADEMSRKPYPVARVILPHDGEAKTIASGKSCQEVLRGRGFRVEIAPKLSVDDGINAVRMLFPRCVFDQDKCEQGIEALRNYRAKWDETNRTLAATPMHDWASHGADAFRYLAVGMRDEPVNRKVIKYRRLANVA